VFCPACGFANTFWGKATADGNQNFVALVTAPGGDIIFCAAVGAAFEAEAEVALLQKLPRLRRRK
jgi:hypothetical protein